MSQQINLFNPVFLKQPKYFSAATMAQALAAVFAGAVLIYAYTAYQNTVLERTAKESENNLKQRREQLVKFGAEYSSSGGSKLLDEELARMDGRLLSRRELLAGLKGDDDMVNDGFSRYLSAFARQNVQGVWLTGFNLGGKGSSVVLKGRALRAELVPVYLQGLGTDEVLRGRAVTELRLSSKEEALKPEAGATQAQPAPAKAAAPAAGAATAVPTMRFIEFSLTMGAGADGGGEAQTPRPAAAAKGAS